MIKGTKIIKRLKRPSAFLGNGKRLKIVLSALVVILILYLSISILAQLSSRRTISTYGTVNAVGVEVYWDYACTDSVSSVDWGKLDPGSTRDVTLYVRNEGTSTLILSMSTSNWDPSGASGYMTLNWDYGGQSISPDEVVQVTFTLSISANIEGITSFSFDITIIGT